MTNTRVLFTVIGFAWVNTTVIAAGPSATPSPSATESPAATIAQSMTDLSAQRAAVDRSKIYRAGRDYSEWLDQLAKDSGSELLQRKVFERVTWMRLVGAIGGLVLLSVVSGLFLWIVRRRAGEIQSRKEQSAVQLAASAIRKPW